MNIPSVKLRDTFKKSALLAGAFGVLFGLLGCASWWLTVPQLYMLRSMPATAFMLCGAALLFLCCQRSWLRWLGRGTALVVFLACVSSMVLQRAGSTGSGILSDNPYQAVISLLFGTMSLYDMIGFALLSLSIALIDLRRGPNLVLVPSEWFAGCGFMMAIMAALGTLFEQARFCLFISCQELSLLAVAAYGLLCGGVLMARTETGMMNIMETPGAGGMTARRILPGALVIPIVLGLLRVVSVKFHLWDAETALPITVCLMMPAYVALIWSSSLKLEQKENQLKDTMRGLEQSEQRVRTIIHESVDAFVAINKSGKICEWSNRAESMFEVGRDVALHAPVLSFLTEVVQVQLLEYFGEATGEVRALVEGEVREFSRAPINPLFHARVPRPDGVTIDIEVMPFIIEANQEKLCCAFIRDVTQRKQLEQRFQDFYHAVSHELRSPLTAIRCSLQTVNETQGDALDTDATKQLHNAIGASDRLIQLINDLLDLRRIELGKFSFDSAVADPILLAQAAVDTLTPLSNLKSLEVILLVESTQQVVCDPARTEQVLINLLSNAIKFAPARGQILVRVSDCDGGSGGDGNGGAKVGGVRFSVSDEGPGIPENQASRLFESFEQLQSPGWEYIPGTGLGLAISRRIVEELGGTIGHANNEPTGSTFWFELVAAPAGAVVGVSVGVQHNKSGSGAAAAGTTQSAPGVPGTRRGTV